jgi:hypothetical protein
MTNFIDWARLRAGLSVLRHRSRKGTAQLRFKPNLEWLERRELLDAAGLVRSIDGAGNNLLHPDWGSTDEQLLRLAPADYADGISTPAGDDRPSAREISNALAAHSDEETPNDRDLTAYIYVWGQFLDHDLDLTGGATPKEAFNIQVPADDPSFDPTGSGTQVIPLSRSIYDSTTGTSTDNPRQQINQITAWIDGSMIYGSDATRAAELRTFSGGKLKTLESSVGTLPPLNTAGLANANDAHRAPNDQLFLAGDVRANENVELTSMHALFIREHNRLADQIAKTNPGLSDEEIYQRARSLVIAEIQVITYKEWLPALLGAGAIKSYRGYNHNVNPGIANEFSTAAFRLHSTINDDVEFFDNVGRPISFSYVDDQGQTVEVDGEVALFDAFFNPTLLKQTGVDGILKYAASTHAEETDNQLVDSLRNFLFGPPGQGGLDLAALNIQRGRDHGLVDYNTMRAAYGLPRVQSFAEITSDTEVQAALARLYGRVDNIDAWVGGLAEDHVRGSSVGPLFQRIIANQFERLRDGDRFWYERVFSGPQLMQLQRTTLADVIERNTGVTNLQDNVFFFRAEARGQVYLDLNGDGRVRRGEAGLAGVQVQLLDDEGGVIDTTTTDSGGRYRFTSFGETGNYQVQIVLPMGKTPTTDSVYSFLISRGGVSIGGLDFGIRGALKPPRNGTPLPGDKPLPGTENPPPMPGKPATTANTTWISLQPSGSNSKTRPDTTLATKVATLNPLPNQKPSQQAVDLLMSSHLQSLTRRA